MPGYARSKKKPNDGEHIRDIVSRVACDKHKAMKGTPCFSVDYDSSQGYGAAICNDRVVKAGFVGEITPNSISRSQRPRVARPKYRHGSATPVPK